MWGKSQFFPLILLQSSWDLHATDANSQWQLQLCTRVSKNWKPVSIDAAIEGWPMDWIYIFKSQFPMKC